MHLKNIYGEESCLFAYLRFMLFMCFLCIKQKRQYFYAYKKHLRRRKSLVWRFVLFCAFYGFYACKKHLSESCFFTFCDFCAHKKHLSESCLFTFCAFCACEIFSWKKKRKKKKYTLIPSFILLLLFKYAYNFYFLQIV